MSEHQIQNQIPDKQGVQKLIVEMDGSMIPIVELNRPQPRLRKLIA
ncbi:MAG: hypothetical protein QNJ63_15865 [Calothrix sp. MO_192.B10]|nr:hypothetical protein [Calothrix sp. MO_192.B10]